MPAGVGTMFEAAGGRAVWHKNMCAISGGSVGALEALVWQGQGQKRIQGDAAPRTATNPPSHVRPQEWRASVHHRIYAQGGYVSTTRRPCGSRGERIRGGRFTHARFGHG